MTIEELQSLSDEIGANAFVLNSNNVQAQDVDLLYHMLLSGTSLIVFLTMRNGPSTRKNPSGHFIALISQPDNAVEIYDPAGGDDVIDDTWWIRDLIKKFQYVDWTDTNTQSDGSTSCGPWALARILAKSTPIEKFAYSIGKKTGTSPSHMSVTRNHTLDAFGPVGREAPHMSTHRAQGYAEYLMMHTNLNEAAAKHVAHIINRSLAHNAELMRASVADVIGMLQDSLPDLEVSPTFMRDVGSVPATIFNEFAKSKDARDALDDMKRELGDERKMVHEQDLEEKDLAGAPLGGALLGGGAYGKSRNPLGEAWGGRKRKARPVAGAKKMRSKAVKPRAGVSRSYAKKRAVRDASNAAYDRMAAAREAKRSKEAERAAMYEEKVAGRKPAHSRSTTLLKLMK